MPNRQIRIFRIQGGQRVPYTLVLDEQLTVLREYAEKTDTSPAKPASEEADNPARRMAKWATDSVSDNPIPGSDELRKQFFEDMQNLVSRYKEGDCPACKKGELIRSYRAKLENLKLL